MTMSVHEFDVTQDTTDPKVNPSSLYGNQANFAIGGMLHEMNPLARLYFSRKNIDRMQHYIRKFVKLLMCDKQTTPDQKMEDLIIAMRATYLQEGRYMSTQVTRQVKELNAKTLKAILPDIISNIKMQATYLHMISNPITPIPLPENVNSAGRRTLRSGTGIYGF